jgi:hypothetical protein
MTATEEPTTIPADVVVVQERRYTIGHGALLHAIEKNYPKVTLPVLGDLHLPPPQQLAWYGGLATLAVVGVLEWPVAIAVCTGHLLSQQHHVQVLRDFGEALEEA